MRRFSPQWFDALRTKRFSREWPGVSGPAAPVMPWVTPPLHPYIRNLFSTRGVVREFGPGEWLFPRVQVRSFMYVEEGLTGRILASLDGQPGAGAMALSPPMRNASGNLNWVTGRAAIGRYQALSHVRVREIRHSEMHDILKPWANQDIFLLVMGQAELINLSDRMGFAVLALLPAIERLKALFLCWSLFYGHIHEENGRRYVRFPVPGRKAHIAQVIRTSLVTLDSLLAELRAGAGYEREGDFCRLEASALQSVHDWMHHADGEGAYIARPKRVEDMLFAAEEEDGLE